MKNQKSLILLLSTILLLSLAQASAINLKIEKETINDVVITELSKPAIFTFSITNLGQKDNFEIFSLVGAEMSPKGTFPINAGEMKKIEVKVFPDESLKKRAGLLTFTYKIRGQESGIQEDTLTINIVGLGEAFTLAVNDLNPESESATISIENKVNLGFDKIKSKFFSAFFTKEENISLSALERKELNIPIDKEKIKKLVAGQYLMTAVLESDGAKATYQNNIKFVEKSGIITREITSGVLVKQKVIEKINGGNVPSIAEISVKKDALSRLFTTFSIEPNKVERKGFTVSYSWFKELQPTETLTVAITTNYLYPFIIILAVIIGLALIQIYTTSDLILKKRINFVKTKGGEFALKVIVTAYARRFVEKISLIDRLPLMMNMHERFGTNHPSRIDEKNRKIEWDIESLRAGEERVFSYIIFSKIGVFGKFELPPATAIYEREGKIKETESNLAFFMNEPRKPEE